MMIPRCCDYASVRRATVANERVRSDTQRIGLAKAGLARDPR